jgi:hypothetical protein
MPSGNRARAQPVHLESKRQHRPGPGIREGDQRTGSSSQRRVVTEHVVPRGQSVDGPVGLHAIGAQISYATHGPQQPSRTEGTCPAAHAGEADVHVTAGAQLAMPAQHAAG